MGSRVTSFHRYGLLVISTESIGASGQRRRIGSVRARTKESSNVLKGMLRIDELDELVKIIRGLREVLELTIELLAACVLVISLRLRISLSMVTKISNSLNDSPSSRAL